ncbi:MAG: hypothetical protein CVV27_19950 [Candidatus Melainabacteria bacterium HGW-Melainabacteria-1]|nr:MAG: hypothetical protein CVV27_19950 [Candidatus Melainabacteria bacterium HGW-Melainabacteria-1]
MSGFHSNSARNARGPAPDPYLRLQNTVQQFIVLKHAQTRLSPVQISQNAATLLNLLDQPLPRAAQHQSSTADLALQWAKLRHALPG